MKKRNKIPTILGVIILMAGVFAGVYLLKIQQIFKIGAGPTAIPKDVRVSNLSDSSATVSWITEGETTDFISWGESQNSLNKVENESESDQKFFTHSINLTGLKANTSYFFKINSDGTDFDNNGVPWQLTTGSQIASNSVSIPVSGSVISSSGQIVKRAIVYIDIGGYILSTLTSEEGNFVLQLGSARSSDLKNYIKIDMAKTLLNVSIQSEMGVSSAQIFPQSTNPIPTLVIGQSKDYRNLQPLEDGQSPGANLDLPEGSTESSKFDTSKPAGTPKPTTVILESLNEGETVTSTEPEFFGKGPAGSSISITIHSTQTVSATVKVPQDGSWSYSPTTPLTEGVHSITISWLDSSGITKTLTRNFVVQAGEAPAFSASGSGSSPTPTVRPTIAPTAAPTLSPVRTATPAATIRPSPTVTPEPVPVTGDLTPTILLSIMGIVVVTFSFFVWKMSAKIEN